MQRSLAGYSPWGHKESDTTEWLSMHTHILCKPQGYCLHIQNNRNVVLWVKHRITASLRSLTSYLYNSVSNILSTLLIELGPSSGGKNLHFAWQAHWMRRAILYIIERTIPNYIFPVDHVICFIFYISKWINIKFPKFKTINNPLWKRLNKMEK